MILYQLYINVIYSSLLLDSRTVQQANMADTEQSVPETIKEGTARHNSNLWGSEHARGKATPQLLWVVSMQSPAKNKARPQITRYLKQCLKKIGRVRPGLFKEIRYIP